MDEKSKTAYIIFEYLYENIGYTNPKKLFDQLNELNVTVIILQDAISSMVTNKWIDVKDLAISEQHQITDDFTVENMYNFLVKKKGIKLTDEGRKHYQWYIEKKRNELRDMLTVILTIGTSIAALYYLAKGFLWMFFY